MCKKFTIRSGIVHLYCDSSSALTKAFGYDVISCNEPSHDIYNHIRQEIKKSPLTIKEKWVKGHQDRKIPYEQLDPIGKANCRVDKIAGQYMESHPGTINIEKRFPPSTWKLQLNGEIINST